MTIREKLLPALLTAFPDCNLRLSDEPACVAVFPAKCPEVGDLSIYDDGKEATVVVGSQTHFHVNCYGMDVTEDECIESIVEEIIEFLRELFEDRILMWSVDQGRGCGGIEPYDGNMSEYVYETADTFLWSGRIPNTRLADGD
jgi:hypothetical protein